MTRQETEEFFLSNLKRKMDFIILISIHPRTCLHLPPQPVGFQGASGKSICMWTEKSASLQHPVLHQNTVNCHESSQLGGLLTTVN